jgi:hypothetical protein
MRELTDQAQQTVYNLAQRYGTSADAVRTLLHAVVAGSGTMAQFSHPDLGGSGQWMSGGMTMVGDMFNSGLQAKVSGLCSELANLIANQQVYTPLPALNNAPSSGFGFSGNAWWPSDFGQPSTSGGQNNFRYAYFPHMQRLVVDDAGQQRIYDTLDHQIGGVSQQQSGYGSGSFTFSSQRGQFTVDSLPLVQPQGSQQYVAPPPPPPPAPAPFVPAPTVSDYPARGDKDEIFSALDKLGNLRDRGILSEDEFLAKKRELLARL